MYSGFYFAIPVCKTLSGIQTSILVSQRQVSTFVEMTLACHMPVWKNTSFITFVSPWPTSTHTYPYCKHLMRNSQLLNQYIIYCPIPVTLLWECTPFPVGITCLPSVLCWQRECLKAERLHFLCSNYQSISRKILKMGLKILLHPKLMKSCKGTIFVVVLNNYRNKKGKNHRVTTLALNIETSPAQRSINAKRKERQAEPHCS